MYQMEFGVFEWRFSPFNTLIINKKEINLKGLNYIEEFPGKGICGSYSEIEKDIIYIKSLGCNSIRVYGRFASPYLLQICDKFGMLVLEEIPVFNSPAGIISSDDFTALAENQLSEMILAHKNRPAVIAYGLGNDFDVSTESGRSYVSRLSSFCKSTDKRIVYYGTRNYANDKCRNLVELTHGCTHMTWYVRHGGPKPQDFR